MALSWIDVLPTGVSGVIGEERAGFREVHSTTSELTIYVFTPLAMIQKQLSRHRKRYVAFIDFRKAFDSTYRGTYMENMEYFI